MKNKSLYSLNQLQSPYTQSHNPSTSGQCSCYGCEMTRALGGSGLQGQQPAVMRQQLMQVFQLMNTTLFYATPANDAEHLWEQEAETVVGPILAYREWKVCVIREPVETHWLGSITADIGWEPGKIMEGDPRSPYGVFAWKKEFRTQGGVRPGIASGAVWLWGDIVEHERGYRAQYAYPAFLFASGIQRSTAYREFDGRTTTYKCSKCRKLLLHIVGDAYSYPEGILVCCHQKDETPDLAALYGVPVLDPEAYEDNEETRRKLLFGEEA